jgi:Uma2 family endonuclease
MPTGEQSVACARLADEPDAQASVCPPINARFAMPDTLTIDAPVLDAPWWPDARQGTVTLDEYFALPEGTPFEFWGGTLIHRVTGQEVYTLDAVHEHLSRYGMTPAPHFFHQLASRSLFLRLHDFVSKRDLGEVLYAPFAVVLEVDGVEHTVEPDLLFFSHKRMEQIQRGRLYGPPELIVEILSPSNPHNDLIRKRNLYDAAGVDEYWIADPSEQRIDVFVAGDHGYVLDQSTEGNVVSRVLDGLTLSVPDLFE